MMLTIHGLPRTVKYQDLKKLIKGECNISEFILDNLVADDGGNSMKMRVGLADEGEGAVLMQRLNGYRISGHLIRVVPVGKSSQMNRPTNNFYGQQTNRDFNQHDYPQEMSQNRSGQWPASNNQWGPNETAATPQNPYSYQQPQIYPQSNIYQQSGQRPRPPGALRSVELVNLPSQQHAFGRLAEKQGPSQYNQFSQHQQGPLAAPTWTQGSQQKSLRPAPPFNLNYSNDQKSGASKPIPGYPRPNEPSYIRDGPAGRINEPHSRGREEPIDRRNMPVGRRDEPHGRGDEPRGRGEEHRGRRDEAHGRRDEPLGRRVDSLAKPIDPNRRRDEPVGRRVSPRRISPGQRVSPGRRASPGRRVSPGRILSSGRRVSPGRLESPGRNVPPGRRMSPTRRVSPTGRRVSPGTRESPTRRYSPSRRFPDKSSDHYQADTMRPPAKQVRPAYEPQASNQTMYSGGYRPNVNENVTYPVSGMRPESTSSWQDKFNQAKKPDDNRRGFRSDNQDELKPARRSRSPNRRERSPLRSQRHSSSRSPCRSWALEKRRSPAHNDAPPPPSWPGHNAQNKSYARKFPERFESEENPMNAWEHAPESRKQTVGPRFDDFSQTRSPREIVDAPKPLSHPERHGSPTRGNQWKDERFPPQARDPLKFSRPQDNFTRDRRPDVPRRGNDFQETKPFLERPSRDDLRLNDGSHREEREFFPERSQNFRKVPEMYSEAAFKVPEDFRKKEDYHSKDRKVDFVEDRREKLRVDTQEIRRDVVTRGEVERPGSRHSDEYRHRRDPDQRPQAGPVRLNPAVKLQRERAAEKLSHRICAKHNVRDPNIHERVQAVLSEKIDKVFEERHVNMDDILVWFAQRFSAAEQDQIFDDVVSRLPGRFDHNKRNAEEPRPDKKSQKEIIKAQYKKTIDEIRRRIIIQNNMKPNSEYFRRVCEELSLTLLKILLKFGERYGPSCDVMNRYSMEYSQRDECRLFEEVLAKVKSEQRKRPAADESDVPAKLARPSSDDLMHPVPDGSRHARPIAKKMVAAKPNIHKNAQKRRAATAVHTPIKKPQRNQPATNQAVLKPAPHKPMKLPTPSKPAAKPSVQTPHRKAVTVKTPVIGKTSPAQNKQVKPVKKIGEIGNASNANVISSPPAPVTGHYELSPLFDRALKAELEQILIKIWPDLPDKPSSEAEKLVVDKLKSEAAVQLGNAIGLGVTKRILNVHNKLLVKIRLDSKPPSLWIAAFRKTFNVSKLQNLGKMMAFTAEMSKIADFDKICSLSGKKMGGVSLTVSPVYNFIQCPPNLKTVSVENIVENLRKEVNKLSVKQDVKDESKLDKGITKETAADAATIKTDPKQSKNNQAPTVNQLMEDKVNSTEVIMSNTTADSKSAESTLSKTANNTVANSKTKVDKTVSASKVTVDEVTKPKAINNVKKSANTVSKSMSNVETKSKVAGDKKLTPIKNTVDESEKATAGITNVGNKPLKPIENVQNKMKTTEAEKNIEKAPLSKGMTEVNKVAENKVASNKVKTPSVNKIPNQEDIDQTELDLLMGDGIVLDECLGSDDE